MEYFSILPWFGFYLVLFRDLQKDSELLRCFLAARPLIKITCLFLSILAYSFSQKAFKKMFCLCFSLWKLLRWTAGDLSRLRAIGLPGGWRTSLGISSQLHCWNTTCFPVAQLRSNGKAHGGVFVFFLHICICFCNKVFLGCLRIF